MAMDVTRQLRHDFTDYEEMPKYWMMRRHWLDESTIQSTGESDIRSRDQNKGQKDIAGVRAR